jgi:hypothetical protein
MTHPLSVALAAANLLTGTVTNAVGTAATLDGLCNLLGNLLHIVSILFLEIGNGADGLYSQAYFDLNQVAAKIAAFAALVDCR